MLASFVSSVIMAERASPHCLNRASFLLALFKSIPIIDVVVQSTAVILVLSAFVPSGILVL